MPRVCACCQHRSRKAIDHALLRNESYVSIARRFSGLSKFAVARHHHQHIPNAVHVAAEVRKRDVKYGNSLLDELENIATDCQRLINAAEGNKDIRAALMGISQQLKIWESHAKLAGAFPAQPNNVTFNQQFNQINLAPEDPDLELARLMQEITNNFAPQEIERYRSLAKGQAPEVQPLLKGEVS